jgi:hypothetical protein
MTKIKSFNPAHFCFNLLIEFLIRMGQPLMIFQPNIALRTGTLAIFPGRLKFRAVSASRLNWDRVNKALDTLWIAV